MITRKREHWLRMLFVWHGSVLPQLLPRLLVLFALSLVVVYFHGHVLSFKVPLNPTPLTMFGFVLALFLGFRNNASYERYWEARKLWGSLLNVSRSLTRQALTLPHPKTDASSVTEFIQLLSSFSYSLKHQLRHTDPQDDLKKRLGEKDLARVMESGYKPAVIINLLSAWVQKERQAQRIDSIQQARFDENLDKLTEIVGGCERIASTPIPYSYRVLLHRTVYIYCLMLPFGLVDTLGWITPVLVAFIAYTFVAFDTIADEIEEPFGIQANDLPLNHLCEMIENTVLELTGEPIQKKSVVERTIMD